MLKPKVSKSFIDMMKLVRNELSLIWNEVIERFQVIHTDKRNGIQRIVMTIENDDSTFRMPDNRDILRLSNSIDWDCLGKYPEPKDMAQFFIDKWDHQKMKKEQVRKEFLKWWTKDNKRLVRAAMDNLQRGILFNPNEGKEPPKIILDIGKNINKNILRGTV